MEWRRCGTGGGCLTAVVITEKSGGTGRIAGMRWAWIIATTPSCFGIWMQAKNVRAFVIALIGSRWLVIRIDTVRKIRAHAAFVSSGRAVR